MLESHVLEQAVLILDADREVEWYAYQASTSSRVYNGRAGIFCVAGEPILASVSVRTWL